MSNEEPLYPALEKLRPEGVSKTEFSKLLGMGLTTYSNMQTKGARITAGWRIALLYMKRYGLGLLKKEKK